MLDFSNREGGGGGDPNDKAHQIILETVIKSTLLLENIINETGVCPKCFLFDLSLTLLMNLAITHNTHGEKGFVDLMEKLNAQLKAYFDEVPRRLEKPN